MLGRSAAALAAVSVLLSFSTTPCAVAGRSHLRGGSGSAASKNPEKRGHSGKRIRGGGGGGGGDGGRKLQQTKGTSAPVAGGGTTPPVPRCHTLFVPAMAKALSGSYSFRGRYNNGHPVYTDAATGNNIFYESSNFYITQPTARLFLSIETDVFEPDDLEEELQPWVRNNDPSCKACTWGFHIACTTLTADATAATAAPTTTPAAIETNTSNSTSPAEAVAPTAAPATAAPATAAPTVPHNSTSSVTDTSAIGGCMSLNVHNGADRTGVYVLNTNAADDALLINGRPSYIGVGADRTANQVFTAVMDVCVTNYGVVDAAWAGLVGDLSPTATAQAVFLMYAAEHVGLGTVMDTAACQVPVWFLTSGGSGDLDAAGEYTFLSLSDVDDPSEATSWAKFTPATQASGATLVENSWIEVGCADANEVEEALEGDEKAGAGAAATTAAEAGGNAGEETEADDTPSAPTPVGTEPNGRRLRARSVVGSEPNGRRLRAARSF